MYKKRNNIFLLIGLFLTILLICFLQISFLSQASETVLALDYVTIQSQKCSVVESFQANGDPKYILDDFVDSDKYHKNIQIEFNITSPYYLLEYSINGEDIEGSFVTETPINNLVTFKLLNTGRYVIKVSAYEDETTFIDSYEFAFKSDNEAPNVDDITSNEMTSYIKSGEKFLAQINPQNASDNISGLKDIKYVIQDTRDNSYSSVYTINNFDIFEVEITYSSILHIFVYDNANNCKVKTFEYFLFDDIKPPVPTYTISPALANNVKRNKYTITVQYLDNDSLSGLNKDQYYTLNGHTYLYAGSITLNESKDYEITLYTLDKVGNRSEDVVINISKNYFDTNAPIISQVKTDIDFDKEKIYSLSFVGSDSNESGLKRAYVKENGAIFKESYTDVYNVYTYDFNPNEIKSLTIVLEDNAGNKAEYVHVVSYYNNTSIENVMNTFVQKYKSKDMNNYNETLKTSIQADMAALEALLLAETTKQNEISDLINTINTKLDTQIVKRFIVGEAPEYVSTILSFDINLDDFSGYKNGDEIIITLSKFETNNIDSSISSLGFAFKDGFNLAIQYNDAPLSSGLVSGIDITMNLPNGYLDRQFELFNANNNQKVEIEIENNTMSYTLKNNTNFVLFVSGGINQSGSKINSQDTITVFGNTFTKTTFWLIVGICGGVAVLAIVFGIIIFIKRR